jgi:hypothetical protein
MLPIIIQRAKAFWIHFQRINNKEMTASFKFFPNLPVDIFQNWMQW